MKKIALIGMGSIGQYLYENLQKDGFDIAFIYVRNKVEGKVYSDLMISTQEEFDAKCSQGVDLVVEAATSDAVKSLAPLALKHTNMAILSSTALADESFYNHMLGLCHEHGTQLYVPHGAVMGLDGIIDARSALDAVTITTTKSPSSLGRTDRQKTIVYDGPTRAVCEQYPRNVNVHATTALAGLGLDKTRSVIISDPDSNENGHEIDVVGQGFAFHIKTKSTTASQVSSLYTLISAYSSIKRLLKTERITVV